LVFVNFVRIKKQDSFIQEPCSWWRWGDSNPCPKYVRNTFLRV